MDMKAEKKEVPASFGLFNETCLINLSPHEELVQTWNVTHVTPDSRSILALGSKGCRDYFMMILMDVVSRVQEN